MWYFISFVLKFPSSWLEPHFVSVTCPIGLTPPSAVQGGGEEALWETHGSICRLRSSSHRSMKFSGSPSFPTNAANVQHLFKEVK